MAKQYEYVFKAKNNLYTREYDTVTKQTELKVVKHIPEIYIPSKEKSKYVSLPERNFLKRVPFKTLSEYKDQTKLFESNNIPMYGLKSEPFGYIRDNYGDPVSNNHDFQTQFFDIETAVLDKTVEKDVSKNDWKPTGHERAAMATITSIQMYDTKFKQFYILGLAKDWNNDDNFSSEYGEIKYIKCETERDLLIKYLTIMERTKPLILSGWNSEGYDIPYITNRIIRVLDGRDDLYEFDDKKKRWLFNRSCLDGEYVKQLSPVNMITHREVENNFGFQDEFQWAGLILEDYKGLYHKYTFEVLTSYSLDSVASHELGANKVEHDEYADFAEFYEKDFDRFIRYGIIDVQLLIEIDNKLNLINLAKSIAYICGVSMPDIRGTVRQWNQYMFNNYADKGFMLPLKGKFGKNDTVILEHANNMENLSLERKRTFSRLLANPELHGQKFAGGITRGTAKFWREVFSLDFGSLYPSCIQWANIGMETLIQPKDLHKDLLDLRAKYAIYYEKEVPSKDLIQFDFAYSKNVLNYPEALKEMEEVLTRHNVSMTPNGMFFRKDKRSILSQTMEDIITQRKVHKSEMKEHFKTMQKIKDVKAQGWEDEYYRVSALADGSNVMQMALKILVNSAYGALSNEATTFAGDKEYFSGAVTSSARIANLLAGQVNSKKVDQIAGINAKEVQYGINSFHDWIPQIDTDSVVGDSIVYIDGEKIKIEDLYENTKGRIEKRDKNNYIKHIDKEIYTLSLNKEKYIVENKKIKYIMAHKVKKRMFKIKHKDTEVIVTEDHSVIVKRNNEFLDVKPKDIIQGDKIIKI